MTENALWETDSFEDLVARGILAQYEKKLHKKTRGKNTDSHLRVGRKAALRLLRRGIYFAPHDRVIMRGRVDVGNDKLPSFACHAHEWSNMWSEFNEAVYLDMLYAERISRFDQGWTHKGKGALYRLTVISPTENKGLLAVRSNFVVNNKGIITPALFLKQGYVQGVHRSELVLGFGGDTIEDAYKKSALSLSSALNFYLDRTHLWNVDAIERGARATFGVYPEQIQSLFYARDLPMTATGRKRPILHWVCAHRRRMRSGVEVEVKKHLRGIDSFSMGGTDFKITRPAKG